MERGGGGVGPPPPILEGKRPESYCCQREKLLHWGRSPAVPPAAHVEFTLERRLAMAAKKKKAAKKAVKKTAKKAAKKAAKKPAAKKAAKKKAAKKPAAAKPAPAPAAKPLNPAAAWPFPTGNRP